ncbi:MAG: proteasome subunit alpha [Thaumarchaeota archaeon]|nr:proteasome subunit alpha [Nitrososphaerota archaeon]
MEAGRYPYFYGPEGRLLQVDAALQAVSRGSNTIGIQTEEYIMLSSQVKPTRPLLDPMEKIYNIDEHIGATGSGYVGDILKLIDEIRLESQRHRLTYDTPIDTASLARHLGNYLHNYTLYSVRPHGASVILGGFDALGLQLLQVDPSGTYFKGQAFAIGQNADAALSVIEGEYKKQMTVEEGAELSTKAIKAAVEEDPLIEFGLVKKDTGKFEKISPNGFKARLPESG